MEGKYQVVGGPSGTGAAGGGCTFNGNKVSVYRAPLSMIELLVDLDPHFTDDSLAPIARFRGDEAGWRLAIWFAERAGTSVVALPKEIPCPTT